MGTSTAGLLWKGLSKDYGGSFREKTVGACSHSERLLIAVNGLLQVFRQDHRRGIMIRNSSQKRRGWTLSCNQQDFQEICERCEAKHPPVMFPTIDVVWQPGSRGQIRYQRKEETIRNQKRVCRWYQIHAAVRKCHSRILVVLTPCGKKYYVL